MSERPDVLRDDRRFSDWLAEAYRRMKREGLLVTSVGADGKPNVMTIGWGFFGWSYEDHPMAIIAIRPATHTFKLLEQVPEFVLGVPRERMEQACYVCGTKSGRDLDKFAACRLTCTPSQFVRPPSIKECALNIECRIYHAQRPPHMILTARHRKAPLEAQHTIYFAQILGAFETASIQ
jgi:flavin reductase (DIM6/NTAB) family NADH-FMN oxidoreductase RutF